MNFLKLFEASSVRKEFLDVYGMPDYDSDQEWFYKHCQPHGNNVAVTPVQKRLSSFTLIEELVGRVHHIAQFSHLQLFVTSPGHTGVWHLDGIGRKASVNIPLFNCGPESTIDWTAQAFEGKRSTSKYTTHMAHHDPDAEIEDSCVLDDSVFLVRTDKWHRINNNRSSKHRVVVALRFTDNPSFDLLANSWRPD